MIEVSAVGIVDGIRDPSWRIPIMDPIPVYQRRKMLDAVDEGGSVADVARRFAVCETTVRNYLRQREAGSLDPKPRSGGAGTKLTDEDRRRLCEALDNRPDATLEELVKTCKLDVSLSTVCRELQKLGRRRKRKIARASERHEPEVRRRRGEWKSRAEKVDPRRLLFLDETGVSTRMTRPYGRAPQGRRVHTDVPARHYESLTVLGGMRLGGREKLPTHVYPGGTTTDRMIEYIEGPLGHALRRGDIVVADNLAAHKAKRVSEALAERHAEIWFLPPYSPDLNPIERLWSKIKTSLRAARATTVRRLKARLSKALSAITTQDIKNWFEHSNYPAHA